jgi:hypothetical protein
MFANHCRCLYEWCAPGLFNLALSAKWEPNGTLGLAPRHVRVGPQSQTLESQCATASASASAGKSARGLLGAQNIVHIASTSTTAAAVPVPGGMLHAVAGQSQHPILAAGRSQPEPNIAAR